MKLVSFGEPGAERPGVVAGDRIIDLVVAEPSLPVTVRGILAANRLGHVEELVADESRCAKAMCPLDSVRLGPPITEPSKIVCLGRNYEEHAAEHGVEAPSAPLLFPKGPNVLCGHNDSIPYPKETQRFDFEVELAFVIGRRAARVSAGDGLRHVAGYSVFLDLTARDLQRSEKQWFRAKSMDGSGPFGPWIVTPDEIPEPHNLDISLQLNGEVMQSSNTRHMKFTVDFLVHYISQTMTLEPGDVVATGTPSGVGEFRNPPRFLGPGDKLVATLERVGDLAVTIGPQLP